MRPVLIVLALVLLVVSSVVGGVLLADWPFWQRAWRWQQAAPEWPSQLPGARLLITAPVPAREMPMASDAAVTAAVSELLDDESTEALLVARADHLLFEYYGQGTGPGTRFDGRELSSLPVMLLYGAAAQRGTGPVLDQGVGAVLAEWREDPRGQITPRQLLQGLSGLDTTRGSFLNPFGRWARLASGPNFERAALRWELTWPPGSRYAANPADAQLAAAALRASAGRAVADLLRDWLVTPLALDGMRVLLDRHRGSMAAHCCVQARARDWLTLVLLLAQDGEVAGERIYPEDFAHEMVGVSPVAPERALGVQRVQLPDGSQALLARGRTRLLLADPHSRAAWLWFRGEAAEEEAVSRLVNAALRARSANDAEGSP